MSILRPLTSKLSTIGILTLALLLTSCAAKEEGSMKKEKEESSQGVMMEKKEDAPSPAVEDAGGAGGRESSRVTPPPPAVGPVTIRVKAENWKFTPAVIRVKKGQKVTLALESMSGTHGFAVPTLGINAIVALGNTTLITLPTDFAGTHSFLCSIPCGAGHKDMIGQIVIEE